jgi:hypothetical protein
VPHVPEVPSLNQTTLTGYELLATELTSADTAIQPLYRKFDYINHRILLHLQDELSELEEQLRILDESIAQFTATNSPPLSIPDGTHRRHSGPPASRRADAFYGNDMHHRRTALLGRIFLKTEQYSRAMAAYAKLNSQSRPASPTQIATYREWMHTHGAIHPAETTFLQKEDDLIIPLPPPTNPHSDDTNNKPTLTTTATSPPPPTSSPTPQPVNHSVPWLIPLSLLLTPLLLFASIPTFSARLAVSIVMAVASGSMIATTPLGADLAPRDWAVCCASYALCVVVVAGLVPAAAVFVGG